MRLLELGDGSTKRVVECGEVEREVFGGGGGDGGGGGGGRGDGGVEGGVEVDDDDEDDEGGGVALPSASTSTSTKSTDAITAKLHVRGEGLTSQQLGVQKAKEREMVRQAGRRGVAFGFEVEGGRRKVDCVKGGRVVESSFAKGEWGVRWRG